MRRPLRGHRIGWRNVEAGAQSTGSAPAPLAAVQLGRRGRFAAALTGNSGLRRLGQLDAELQAAALAGDQDHAARGWYSDTPRVPLGQAIIIEPDKGDPNCVWRYPGLEVSNASTGDHVGAIRTLLDRSVASAIEGHAVVAVSLSGGLDSGLVAESALRSAGNSSGQRALKAWCYAPENGAATAPPGDWVTDEAQAAAAFAEFHKGRIELEIARAEGTDFRASVDDLLAIARCAPREMALAY